MARQAEALRQSLDDAGPNAWIELDRALADEGLARHEAMLAGIEAYRHHPYARNLPEPPVLWREGTSRVLDYHVLDYRAGDGGLPVLAIPSLVNRAYVLDLTARRSLMRDLAARGMSPFLVDWDAPGAEERRFTLDDYVARLGRMLDSVAAATGRKVVILGYCMGGDLALALAQTHPRHVAAMALLATPWDFHAEQAPQGSMLKTLAQPLETVIDSAGCLPADMLNSLFASLDPNLAARKFAAFARLKRTSARARDFVALEDWVNDSVALAGPVARECLFRWYGDNSPAKGQWRIGGLPVLPEKVTVPTLVMIPERDRIVPPQSSEPLARAIPGARTLRIPGGHVGMLLSSRAKTEVYGPLARWLTRTAAQ